MNNTDNNKEFEKNRILEATNTAVDNKQENTALSDEQLEDVSGGLNVKEIIQTTVKIIAR